MIQSLSFFSTLFILLQLIQGCTTAHVSDYVQRGDRTYEIRTTGPKKEVGETFFVTSYKLCQERYDQGFKLLHWRPQKLDTIHAIIECSGKPDKFWKEKFNPQYTDIKEAKSHVFHGGGRFNFSLDELQNQGMRVR